MLVSGSDALARSRERTAAGHRSCRAGRPRRSELVADQQEVPIVAGLPPKTGFSWQPPQNVTFDSGPSPSSGVKRRIVRSRPRSKAATCSAVAEGSGAPSSAKMPSATCTVVSGGAAPAAIRRPRKSRAPTHPSLHVESSNQARLTRGTIPRRSVAGQCKLETAELDGDSFQPFLAAPERLSTAAWASIATCSGSIRCGSSAPRRVARTWCSFLGGGLPGAHRHAASSRRRGVDGALAAGPRCARGGGRSCASAGSSDPRERHCRSPGASGRGCGCRTRTASGPDPGRGSAGASAPAGPPLGT